MTKGKAIESEQLPKMVLWKLVLKFTLIVKNRKHSIPIVFTGSAALYYRH